MNFSKETILITNDSQFQRAVIKEVFGEYFNLLEAGSGGECMRIIQENPANIDLVLLDLVMPGIDGFEVLRRRQNMQDFLDIPVIVLTTSDTPDVQTNVYELGANDFLIKPINKATALARIQNLLKSKHRVRSLKQKCVEFKVKSELDEMTGLFNKATTLSLITNILSAPPLNRHALLVVDIDNFKAINDVFGHTVGDHTISVISNVIASRFADSDIVGRIGGDEFIIFIQNVLSKQDVYKRTDELVQAISAKENLSIPDNVTISIGLAFSNGSERDYSSLFSKADEALYFSKHAGKSCYREYDIDSKESDTAPASNIFVLSGSRNVLSMLEFACEPRVNIIQAASIDALQNHISDKNTDISSIYLDISAEPDNGRKLLRSIAEIFTETIPIIVICQEGCMEQIRFASAYSFTSDIIFSPLETATLKRRIAEHKKMNL